MPDVNVISKFLAKARGRSNAMVNRHFHLIVSFLSLAIFILLIAGLITSGYLPFDYKIILTQESLTVSTVARNIATTFGIIIGATWAYFLFVKGRTFTSKVKIKTSLVHMFKNSSLVILLRCEVENIGKTKVNPKSIGVKIYRGDIVNHKVQYTLVDERQNILENYSYYEDDVVYIEPADILNIDFDVLVSNDLCVQNSASNSERFILVKVNLVDDNYYVCQHNSVLILE